jgi:thiopeptide-type bacteriocin biosynthesis protein
MGTCSWISAHIYYHDDLDGLIESAVCPLAHELRARGMIAKYFFIRHWQGGPHLRLRLLPEHDVDPVTVVAAVDGAIRPYLLAHPGKTVISQADYLRVAEPLSAFEPGQRTVEALEPNNTLRQRSYQPEYERYGGTPEAMEAVERHFMSSSDLAFEILTSRTSRDQRTGQALSMLFVAAAVCEGSSKDVATFWRAAPADPVGGKRALAAVEQAEASFEQRYIRQRPRLRAATGRLAQMVERGVGAHSAPIARWRDSLEWLKARLLDLQRAGRFTPSKLQSSDERGADGASGIRSVLQSCSHMNSNRLGISLPEEAYLRYLLGRLASEGAEDE